MELWKVFKELKLDFGAWCEQLPMDEGEGVYIASLAPSFHSVTTLESLFLSLDELICDKSPRHQLCTVAMFRVKAN